MRKKAEISEEAEDPKPMQVREMKLLEKRTHGNKAPEISKLFGRTFKKQIKIRRNIFCGHVVSHVPN